MTFRTTQSDGGRAALAFVLLIGALSFFADFTHEGSWTIVGPYLAALGASATIVGAVTGLGEALAFGLQLLSGRFADWTRQFWPITIFGYIVQMLAIPALALTGNWPLAAGLIILERIGKAIRTPPRDVMLSHAAKDVGGYGHVFGLHEILDRSGAMVGPLLVAAILAHQGSYRQAFGVMLVPAVVCLGLVAVARLRYPQPQDLEIKRPSMHARALPRIYWIYFVGAALVAAGFADYPLIAYHFSRAHTVPPDSIAIFYAAAMGIGGGGSLVVGRLFDRFGFRVLIWLALLTAAFAPLVFLGDFWLALVGVVIWGVGAGVHESIIPAAIAPMVAPDRRASAFGLFTAGYGLFWFLGSLAIGILYDRSAREAMGFCLVAELAAVPVFLWVAHENNRSRLDPSNDARAARL